MADISFTYCPRVRGIPGRQRAVPTRRLHCHMGAGRVILVAVSLKIFCRRLDQSYANMAPSHTTVTTADGRQGPHPSYIKSAKPFIFDREIRECLTKGGSSANRDNKVRLEGISWIDGVRRALHLWVVLFGVSSCLTDRMKACENIQYSSSLLS